MCIMHEADAYGTLIINGQKLNKDLAKRLIKSDSRKFSKAWDELIQWGVIRNDQNGVFFSKRMVEDEKLRRIKSESGKKGGNPNLVNHEVNHTPALNSKNQDNQNSTSSSSTSISSSSTLKYKNKFNPPTLEKIEKYILEKEGDQELATLFFNFYESNGWKVGKNQMKDWKAAARNWITRQNKKTNGSNSPINTTRINAGKTDHSAETM